MANQSDLTILEDGPRNAVVRYTIALDGASTPPLATVVSLANFTNNDVGYTALTGFRVDKVVYSVDQVLSVRLYWGGTGNLELITALQASGEDNYKSAGGLQPVSTRSGYNGSIMVEVAGLEAGHACGANILLYLVKLYKR